MPAVLDEQAIPTLKAGTVCEANNRLTESRHPVRTRLRGGRDALDSTTQAPSVKGNSRRRWLA